MTGPNKKNAKFLAGTGIFDLADRLFSQWTYDTAIYNAHDFSEYDWEHEHEHKVVSIEDVLRFDGQPR